MEKTVLINCSPKRRLSVSGFLMRCAGILIRGKKEYLQLRTPADRPAILQALKTAGKVVFVTPLYVDSVPSHMLPFMREMEAFCRENGLRLKVYVIANNGFIEGKQNEPKDNSRNRASAAFSLWSDKARRDIFPCKPSRDNSHQAP